MSGRAVVTAVAGTLGAAVLTVALVLGLVAAHGATSCTTVGFLNLAPLEIETGIGVDAVSACIGAGCAPVALTRGDDGTWKVPQQSPYLADGVSAGAVGEVTVRAESGGRVVADATVPVTRTSRSGSGQCPGPFDYEPMTVPSTLAAR
jgi:hypothetical protein